MLINKASSSPPLSKSSPLSSPLSPAPLTNHKPCIHKIHSFSPRLHRHTHTPFFRMYLHKRLSTACWLSSHRVVINYVESFLFTSNIIVYPFFVFLFRSSFSFTFHLYSIILASTTTTTTTIIIIISLSSALFIAKTKPSQHQAACQPLQVCLTLPFFVFSYFYVRIPQHR